MAYLAPTSQYGIYYHKKKKQFTCRICDKKTGHLLAAGTAPTRDEALRIAQANLPVSSSVPIVFAGEMMQCTGCLKKELSNPDTDWVALRMPKLTFYFCPDCYRDARKLMWQVQPVEKKLPEVVWRRPRTGEEMCCVSCERKETAKKGSRWEVYPTDDHWASYLCPDCIP